MSAGEPPRNRQFGRIACGVQLAERSRYLSMRRVARIGSTDSAKQHLPRAGAYYGFDLMANVFSVLMAEEVTPYFYSIIFLEQRRGALRPVISWSIAPPPCGGLNDGHERGSVNSNS